MSEVPLDATAQAELVRRGEVSPEELVEEAIARIERVDPEINAVVIPTFEKARAEAKTAEGPFKGVPYVLKDTMASKGDMYTASIIGVKNAGYISDYDPYFVQAMRKAGFVLVGRSHTPEMAIVWTTESHAFGKTRNPWDTELSTGGSSGGSAAAVAAGLVPVAHGSDDPGRLKIAVCPEDPAGAEPVDPECAAATRAVADKLADLGHDVSDAYPAAIKEGSWPEQFMPCVPVVVMREIERFGRLIGRELTEDDMEIQTWAYVQAGKQVTAPQYAAGIDSLRHFARDIENFWFEEGWDILLTPTLTIQTPRLGLFNPTPENPMGSLGLNPSRFTVPFNVAGLPALSLPLGMSSAGVPIGVQIGAGYGREDQLIQLAAQLEEALPWADRRPKVSV